MKPCRSKIEPLCQAISCWVWKSKTPGSSLVARIFPNQSAGDVEVCRLDAYVRYRSYLCSVDSLGRVKLIMHATPLIAVRFRPCFFLSARYIYSMLRPCDQIYGPMMPDPISREASKSEPHLQLQCCRVQRKTYPLYLARYLGPIWFPTIICHAKVWWSVAAIKCG
jgi:hypothetical protein